MTEAIDDPIKAAELRGYSRGYSAGKRRESREETERQRYRRECAFWQRAFLAALPAFIDGDAWTSGGKKMDHLEGRVEMARITADRALSTCKYRIP